MLSAPPITCANHRRRDRVAACGSCGNHLCGDCVVHTSVGIKCRRCTGVSTAAPRVEGGTGAVTRRRWPVPVLVAGLAVAVIAGFAVATSGGGGGTTVVDDASGEAAATAVDRPTSLEGAKGLNLAATLTLPAGAGGDKSVPGVLIIPGGATLDRNSLVSQAGGVPNPLYQDLALAAAGSGLASLRYDRRGTAEARPPAGEALAFDDFVVDARAGVDFLAQRRETSGAPLAVVGYDDGGLVALRVAASDPRVQAVVLISTTGRPLVDYLAADFIANDPQNGPAVADALRAAVEQVKAGRMPPQASLPAALRPMFSADPSRAGYMKELFSIDPAAEARPVGVPVLILRGGLDTAITDADVAPFMRAFKGGVQVTTGAQADHSLMLPVSHDAVVHKGLTETPRDQDALATFGEWLRARLVTT